MKDNQKPMDIDVSSLVSLMANAYEQGLKAGHKTPSMKDNAEFAAEAVQLFTSGLTDSLAFSFGNTAH